MTQKGLWQVFYADLIKFHFDDDQSLFYLPYADFGSKKFDEIFGNIFLICNDFFLTGNESNQCLYTVGVFQFCSIEKCQIAWIDDDHRLPLFSHEILYLCLVVTWKWQVFVLLLTSMKTDCYHHTFELKDWLWYDFCFVQLRLKKCANYQWEKPSRPRLMKQSEETFLV